MRLSIVRSVLNSVIAIAVFSILEILTGRVIEDIWYSYQWIVVILPPLMAFRGNILAPYLCRYFSRATLGRGIGIDFIKFNILVALTSSTILSIAIPVLSSIFIVVTLGLYVDILDIVVFTLITTIITVVMGIAILTPIIHCLLKVNPEIGEYIPTLSSSLMDYLTSIISIYTLSLVSTSTNFSMLLKTIFIITMILLIVVSIKRLGDTYRLYASIKENSLSGLNSFWSLLSGVIIGIYAQGLYVKGVMKFFPLINALMGISAGIFYVYTSRDLHVVSRIRKKTFIDAILRTFVFISIAIICSTIFIESLEQLAIASLGLVLGAIVLLPITIAVSRLSIVFKWDPDNVVIPVVTGLGDVLGSTILILVTQLI